MSQFCNHPTSSHGLCGRPVFQNQSECRFHSDSNHGGANTREALQQYIEDTEGDEIEFHQVQFNISLFENNPVEFDKEVLFSKTMFNGCSLKDVIFHKNVTFQDCTLVEASFVRVQFHARCDFPPGFKSTLKKCDFRYCNFDQDFRMAEVHLDNSSFGFSNFLGYMELYKCNLVDTTFLETRFTGDRIAIFRTLFSLSATPFESCVFGTKGSTSICEIKESSIVTKSAAFRGCIVHSSTFSLETSSIECSRLLMMACRCAINNSPRHLLIASNKINLSRFVCTGHFEYSNHEECTSDGDHEPPAIDLSHIIFPQMQSAVFLNANLKKASFKYSVIDNVNFINCKWDRRPKNSGRQIVYDDKSRTSDVSMTEVLRQYIQLKKNFENQRDFVGAGDWSYREMECRESLAKKRLYRFGLRWYRRLAQYGEAYWTPLIWLVLSIPLFGFFYLFNGIPIKLDGRTINYELFQYGPFSWGDIWHAMRFSAVAMSLQLGKSVDMMDWDGIWLYIPHLVLTFTLVSLFLLALRRKFRR